MIRSLPEFGGADGSFRYKIVAEDPDGDRLRYGASQLPEGMTVSADSGEVSWMPREDQAGVHPVVLFADDPAGARATQRFELTIGGPAETAAAPAKAAE